MMSNWLAAAAEFSRIQLQFSTSEQSVESVDNFRGLRATVMGLGRHGGGVAVARFLAAQGAVVTVTDLADEAALIEPLADLADAGIERFHLGGHQDDDFRLADLVVVNPAVRPGSPFVELARESGARITSEIELFLNACPAPVIGVTGTSGKSTTAAMTAAILGAAARRTWLGGNIGVSLLADLPRIEPGDRVVLELSSFQLFWLNEEVRWPRWAVVTNFSPNHLDWHGRLEFYAAAKQRLLQHVAADGAVILDRDNPVLQHWASLVHQHALLPPSPLEQIPPLCVPGPHNRVNASLAAAASLAAGVDTDAVWRGLSQFTGLPHRLVRVAEVDGRQFFNDSKSTTPAATLAAMDAIDRPVWLLLGGADKQIDLTPLAQAAARYAAGAAVYGAVGPTLDELLALRAPLLPRCRTKTLDEALGWCWAKSRPGDAILLSPGCSSLDQFRDYAERGQRFEQLVARLRDSCAAAAVV